MNDAESDPDPDDVPMEQALEAVAPRLAGVTAAVDGFAERQQDLLGRDYSEDLALIHQSCEDLRETIVAKGEDRRYYWSLPLYDRSTFQDPKF